MHAIEQAPGIIGTYSGGLDTKSRAGDIGIGTYVKGDDVAYILVKERCYLVLNITEYDLHPYLHAQEADNNVNKRLLIGTMRDCPKRNGEWRRSLPSSALIDPISIVKRSLIGCLLPLLSFCRRM